MGALNTIMTEIKIDHQTSISGLTRARVRQPKLMKSELFRQTATVGGLIDKIQMSNSPTVLLGECADGLPFIIELGNPQMGAMLIGCDHGAGKTHHLQVLAESAVRMNAPSALQLGVITFKPGEWQSWAERPENKQHLQGIFAWYDPWAESLIKNLIALAEARYDGRQSGAQVLLLLDDKSFIEELSYEAQMNLHWLLEYGAQVGISLVATINAHRATQFRFWMQSFRTRIIGRVLDQSAAKMLTQRGDSAADGLDPSIFRVWTGAGWRTYRLPLLGD